MKGLQHEDGHSHLLAATVPSLLTYDPAFAYEIALIVQDGLRRMYAEGEDVFYYLTLYNENYQMPPMPEGVQEGVLKGLYKFRKGPKGHHTLRPTVRQRPHPAFCAVRPGDPGGTVRRFRRCVERHQLQAAAHRRADCQRWNMLHPTEPKRKSYLEQLLAKEQGPFVAVSDYMKLVPDQIAPWVPGGLLTLGTDGFGRSDTRAALRRFFEIDAESIVVATLYALAEKGKIKKHVVADAIKDAGCGSGETLPGDCLNR